MALLSAFGIAYRLAEKYRTLDPLSAGAMSLVAFVMTIPQVTLFTPADGSAAQLVKGVLPVGMIGSQGLFVAIVISLLSTEIYRLVASRNPHARWRTARGGEIFSRPDPRFLRAGRGAGAAPAR